MNSKIRINYAERCVRNRAWCSKEQHCITRRSFMIFILFLRYTRTCDTRRKFVSLQEWTFVTLEICFGAALHTKKTLSHWMPDIGVMQSGVPNRTNRAAVSDQTQLLGKDYLRTLTWRTWVEHSHRGDKQTNPFEKCNAMAALKSFNAVSIEM